MVPMPVRSKTIMCFASLSCAVLICIAPGGAKTPAQVLLSDPQNRSQDTLQLEPGKTLDRKISAAQTHNYKISVNVGQFINLIVEQRALQLAVTLYAPGGATLSGEFQSQLWAAHLIAVVAQDSGDYRLEVQATATPRTAKSTYSIRLCELRVAGESERRRAKADGQRYDLLTDILMRMHHEQPQAGWDAAALQ